MNLTGMTEAMRQKGEKALVPFLTAGYPDESTFLGLVEAAAGAGCRLMEIGIPFSDPIADGPVIQASSEKALANGMTLRRAIALAAEARRNAGIDIVLMGYVNPILRMGVAEFADSAREAGVAGAIIPDVPGEESAGIRRTLAEGGLTLIDLVAPTSSNGRIEAITKSAEGFVYLVALTGVTGSSTPAAGGLGAFAGKVREHTKLPLYAGFGISTPEHAARAVRHADGVIIGSALIRIIESSRSSGEAVAAAGGFLRDIHQAINPTSRSLGS